MRDPDLLMELSANARGKVQGVGFRATAKRLADELKLTGFVRNLADGSVEICAQGQRAQLEEFLSQLQQKFPAGPIDADFHKISTTHTDFKIN